MAEGGRNILVVDNHDSFTFNLTALLREAGFGFDVMKNDRLDFQRIGSYAKILISPGPGIPSEAGGICRLIDVFAPEKSILGVCLGHQAIAVSFGGHLECLPHPEHGIVRRIRILDRSERIFSGLPEEITAGLYHSWTVSAKNMPPCLRMTATSSDGAVMAIVHRTYDVKGVQFHPESIMTAYGAAIIRNWATE